MYTALQSGRDPDRIVIETDTCISLEINNEHGGQYIPYCSALFIPEFVEYKTMTLRST